LSAQTLRFCRLGLCGVGDEVEIVGLGETRTSVVTGVETFHKIPQVGQAGDNVGCLLREDLRPPSPLRLWRGDVISFVLLLVAMLVVPLSRRLYTHCMRAACEERRGDGAGDSDMADYKAIFDKIMAPRVTKGIWNGAESAQDILKAQFALTSRRSRATWSACATNCPIRITGGSSSMSTTRLRVRLSQGCG
jgi:hypothetical protein